MTHAKPHLGRFAAFFLVGALVMAPLTASAAPSVAVVGNSLAANGNGNGENGNSGDEAPGNSGDSGNPGNGNNGTDGENGNSGGENPGNGNSGNETPGNSGDPGNGNNGNTGTNGNSGNETPGNSGNPGNGNNGNTGANGNSGNAGPAGVAAGLGAAPPSLTPSGVTPTQGGLGSIDVRLLPAHLGAAIVMFDQDNETLTSIPEPVAAPMGMVSGRLVRELAPVLPPMLVDVVAAPFVVIEALIDAMAASGQALVIPFLAGAAGLMAPGVRRKNLLAEALGQNPDSGS
jgi:hypothetical protein